jgi:phosphoglucomutase
MRQEYFHPQGQLRRVKMGTSGDRGLTGQGFSDQHVAAITQALVDIQAERGTFGPDLAPDLLQKLTRNGSKTIILGKDVRFTSDFAQRTAAEVFAANGYTVIVHKGERATPTPVISHAILAANENGAGLEGGIITASHNSSRWAGIKSNGLNGGPNTRTGPIDVKSNHYLDHPAEVKRLDYDEAIRQKRIVETDLITPYVEDLASVIRFDHLKGGHFGAAPLGGAACGYYEAISARYGFKIDVRTGEPDPAGANSTYDWDGDLRRDPSSKYVMAALQGMKEELGVPFVGANDNDSDRFGGDDRTAGILDPNHVLCVVFDYLAKTRGYPQNMGIGRTIGTTHLLDLIANDYDRPVHEVNVGFKYYVDGLYNGRYVLAGEESAGYCVPRLDGRRWVTEKDGIVAVLQMMEIINRTGKDLGTLYGELVAKYGPFQYEREDTAATSAKKARLDTLAKDPAQVRNLLAEKKIAGRNILWDACRIGDGIKIVLDGGIWVLKRASGTEDIIKDYKEERGENLINARRASEELDHYLGLVGL